MTNRKPRNRTPLLIVLICLVTLFATAAYGQLDPRDQFTIKLPDATWILEMQTPGFKVHKDETAPDGARRYVYAVGQDPDVALSVRLERPGGPRTAEDCRRYAWDHLRARSPFRMDEVAMSERKDLAVLEYRVKEVRGLPVEQLHLHGYLAKDDVCVEVHVSKVRSTAADRPALAAILESVRIRPRVF